MHRYLFDLWSSWRTLRRSPGLAISGVAALAMGIGFTTTIFSIVHGALRELPFAEPERLVVLTKTAPRLGASNMGSTGFDYLEWRRQQRSFEDIAAFNSQNVNLGGDDRRPERYSATFVTPNTFRLLGERPALGRDFLVEDAGPGATAVAILSHDVWRNRFAADAAVIGRAVRVDGTPVTIVGVMPPGFGFPLRAALWLPLDVPAAARPRDRRTSQGFTLLASDDLVVFGRLRPGIEVDEARAELATIADRLADLHPATHDGLSARVFPFVEIEMAPDTERVLYLMLGIVSLVLVIACANVANLLLARAASRTRDVAIRTALGASRRSLMGLHLTESLVLAALGGTLGLVIAHVGVGFFDRATANIIEAFWIDFRVDGTVVAFATALIMMAAVAAGILPAIRASSADVAEVLKDETGGTSSLRIGRLARSLVVVEVAVATGLLILTATFVKSAISLRAVDLPFLEREILTAQVGVREEAMADPEVRARLVRGLSSSLSHVPGVGTAALVSYYPGRGTGHWSFSMDGEAEESVQHRPLTSFALVTPAFLDVLGATVVRGRNLEWRDDRAAPPVALVNESFERRYSRERDVIGRQVDFGELTLTVVGVVPDLQIQDVDDRTADGVYASMLQVRPYAVRVMALTAGDPLAAVPALLEAVETVDPDLPVFEIATLREAIYADKKVLDAFSTLFFVFGVGAVFLTAVGLYGVVSFAVSRRTREIGIRVALGAAPRQVAGLVLREGAALIGIGTAVGLPMAYALSRVLAAAVEPIEPAGPLMFAAIATILAGVALAGLARPARRALALDPSAALRAE